jgi:hypothetical protein
MPRREFRATIREAGSGAFVDVPFDVEAVFGRKRVPVRATFDGEPYRGSLVRMGGPAHMLIVLKEIRQKIGKGPGDEVAVTLEEDNEPRVVEVPDDLARALGTNVSAKEYFETLSFTHQREYVQWILEAKRDATRVARIEKAVTMLEQQKKAK